ncbi:MAG: class I SAM-dependent methyltransferase [Gammaproteobacteria bacterium]|nr:class I SAM-dependent methyltransferase [Gammaproteobacteria bacterium]
MPETPGRACDIGAGTGRDAHWLADMGWQVTAVEPEAAFRRRASLDCHEQIDWLDDCLPALTSLLALKPQFHLILLSAVWMHLPESEREQALSVLSELLASDGVLVISLRHSHAEERQERGIFPVSVAELERLASTRGLAVMSVTQRADQHGRDHVSWETVVLATARDSHTE